MNPLFNGHGSEDSTWKIVYMDMITMLMILFLSLWIVDRGSPEDLRKHGDVTLTKVQFEADDYFDPGKSTIKSTARDKMDKLFFSKENAFPTPGFDAVNSGRRVVLILGHTDDVGDKQKNFELGFDRAMAVYQELKGKIPTLAENVGICSYADNFPVRRVKTPQVALAKDIMARLSKENGLKRKKNRRFEIIGQFEEFQDQAAER